MPLIAPRRHKESCSIGGFRHGVLSAQDFATKVITSYRLAIPSSEAAGDNQTALRKEILDEVVRRESGELVMPAWEGDPKVRPRVMDLYTYLRARADGALGPGQPPRLQE